MDVNVALDSIKSLKSIMTEEDFGEFLKSQDSESLRSFPEVQEFLKSEGYNEEEEEEEPKKPNDVEEEEEEENEAEEIKKSISSLESRFDEESKILKSIPSILENQEELQKSVSQLIDIVQKMSGMPLETKAIKSGSANFFEKSFGSQEDGDGVTPLSIVSQKEQVLVALEKGMGATDNEELIKSYEDSIVRYNAGGGLINQAVAIDLYKNHKIRLQR